jgi:Family of unknown function (DUF5941)
MSAIAAGQARPAAERPDPLALQRDDGAIALALGRAGVRVPALALFAVAALPLVVLVAVGGDGVSTPVAGAAIAWLVVLGGLSRGGRPDPRLDWTVLPALRLCEYAGLLWLAALAGASSLPAAFALVAVVAFRHYELMYRLRLRGAAPAAWANVLSGGWDGRLLAGWLLLAAGALPAGFYVLAGLLAVVLAAETVQSWRTAGRSREATLYDDEEEAE